MEATGLAVTALVPASAIAAKARVLDQLVNGALENRAYPDEDQFRAGTWTVAFDYLEGYHRYRGLSPEARRAAAQELVLVRSGFGGQDWIYHDGEEGWAWYPRDGHPLVLRAPARDFDPARWFREEARRRRRVAVARELAVMFADVFPREIIIQIYLEVFWSA